MIFWTCFLGYLLIALVTARRQYQRVRPYTEPLSCPYSSGSPHKGKHAPRCYRRFLDVDTPAEAIVVATAFGILWPFLLPVIVAVRFVTGGTRPLPEETRAQIERLEIENEQLKQQQEKRGKS